MPPMCFICEEEFIEHDVKEVMQPTIKVVQSIKLKSSNLTPQSKDYNKKILPLLSQESDCAMTHSTNIIIRKLC